MGLLRILLALSVVIRHAPSSLHGMFLDGRVAVQGFFVISGFYMAMVLHRKYDFKGGTYLFYQQRYLRLAPMYWVALAVTLAAALVHAHVLHRPSAILEPWLAYGSRLSPETVAVLLVSQLTMFGLDALVFYQLAGTPLHLVFTPHWTAVPLPAVDFAIISPGWSISVELLFYILAPFLVRRPVKVQMAIILASLMLRFAAYRFLGYFSDAWSNGFFPFEIGLFMTGSLSYRWLGKAEGLVRSSPIPCAILAVVFFSFICIHGFIPLPEVWNNWLFLAVTAVMVPILFAATQHWGVDRWIGELSYPLYLLHEVTLYSIFPLLVKVTGIGREGLILVAPLTVAVISQHFLERNFDRFRARIFEIKARSRKPLFQ